MISKLCFVFALMAALAGIENARGRNVVLAWNPSASSSVAGYNVYYGTSSGSYLYKIDAGNSTSLTVSNVTPGLTYYFAAAAYDNQGDQSLLSNEVSFIVPGVMTLTPAASSGGAPLLQFPVEPGHWYEVQATTDLQNWISIWQSSVAVSNVWMQFTDPNAAAFASRFYRLVLH